MSARLRSLGPTGLQNDAIHEGKSGRKMIFQRSVTLLTKRYDDDWAVQMGRRCIGNDIDSLVILWQWKYRPELAIFRQ